MVFNHTREKAVRRSSKGPRYGEGAGGSDWKASAAKAAEGDAPVFAYIAALPEPQRGIAECVDALASRSVPGLRRAVKWGMAITKTTAVGAFRLAPSSVM